MMDRDGPMYKRMRFIFIEIISYRTTHSTPRVLLYEFNWDQFVSAVCSHSNHYSRKRMVRFS